MVSNQSTSYIIVAILLCLLISETSTNAQVEVIDGIQYKQISNFEQDYSIVAMKISGDGTKIVFSTGGPAVKVYTIDSDGTGLKELYDFQRTGTGPTVDISANGAKVIWSDGEGEIYIANSDGTNLLELATLLPNPDPSFADIEPIIPLPPRITADGSQVLFIHMGRDPRASGAWRINSDNSGLTQIFKYYDMADYLFGTDTVEYSYNIAFVDGFDISADGKRMIFGTRIFKLAAGDLNRGDAIALDGSDFYNVGEYVLGTQPFSTYVDGDHFVMFRREFNTELGYDEINVYFVPLGTGDPVQVISGIDIFGTSAYSQMASDGSRAIVYGTNGRLPITLVDRVSQSRLDLVSIDALSIAMDGYRFSESRLPSITWSGDKFCFLSSSYPSQIWVATINSDAINSEPSISQIQFTPDHVGIDGSSFSTISAHVAYPGHEIHTVTYDAFRDGAFIFRALTADWPFSRMLLDDGTLGDESAADGLYTNNTVRSDLPETPLGSYTVRIAAADDSKHSVSSADAIPFHIVESTVSTGELTETPGFKLYQNYPNPFSEITTIRYEIPVESLVEISVFDVLGKVAVISDYEMQVPGVHSVNVDARGLHGGFYFYSLRAGDYFQVRKLQVLD